MRLVALGERHGLRSRPRAQRALDPRLLAEHQPEAPVDDVVVVDDQDPQRTRRLPGRTGGLSRHREPPAAPASCPGRCDRTRRRRRAEAPRARPAAAPSPTAPATSLTPSLATTSTKAASSRPTRTFTWRGLACFWALRIASTSTDWASASSSCGTSAGSPATSSIPSAGCSPARRDSSAASVVPVGRECAAQRPLDRLAQLGQRGLELLGAALPRGVVQRAVAGERERHAEEALDRAVVDVTRHVDALLELAGALRLARRDARHGRQRGGLAERPQQVALVVPDRRRVGRAVADDDPDPATRRDHRRDDELAVLARGARTRAGRRRSRASRRRRPPAARGGRRRAPRRSRRARRTRRCRCPRRRRRAPGGARRRSGRSPRGRSRSACRSPRTGRRRSRGRCRAPRR